MKVSLNNLLNYITPQELNLPDDWDRFFDLLEDIGLEVKRVDHMPEQQDIIFTLELLANRGDHHCYFGLAREIHLRTGWPLQTPEITELAISQEAPLAQVSSDKCLAYTLTEYSVDQSSGALPRNQLPKPMIKMIELSGTNIIAPAVDVTNFVNIEMGQPMHVFDADKVIGQVQVRDSLAGEQALLLGAQEPVTLPTATLVIADQEKILAVAGVMGCEDSKPTASSQRFYLESGTFDPVAVRKAARALNVQSLSSARFERGADPALAIDAVYRAHHLLSSIGWIANKGLGVCRAFQEQPLTIDLAVAELNHYFAIDLTSDDLISVFQRMGSGSVQLAGDQRNEQLIKVEVPSHRRWDITHTTDLFEEFARAYGYNRLPAKMPVSASGARPAPAQRRLEEVESLLVSEGFFEIFTDSFYSDQDVARLNLPESHPLQEHVRLNNSESKAYSLLKNNNIIQALDGISANLRVKNQQVQAFERNKRFIPSSQAANGLCEELKVIWGMAVGQSRLKNWQNSGVDFDIFALKGLVERIGQRLGLQLRITPQPTDETLHPYLVLLHPARRAVVEHQCSGDQAQQWRPCGVLGEVHPRLVKDFGLKSIRPYFFELEEAMIYAEPRPQSYAAPGTILPVKRDLCFGLYDKQQAGYIADWLAAAGPWLDSVDITDLFEPPAEQVRAVTYSLLLNPLKAQKEVFSGVEINDEIERLAQGVVEHFGADKVVRR